jgi:hypothetical protein
MQRSDERAPVSKDVILRYRRTEAFEAIDYD